MCVYGSVCGGHMWGGLIRVCVVVCAVMFAVCEGWYVEIHRVVIVKVNKLDDYFEFSQSLYYILSSNSSS